MSHQTTSKPANLVEVLRRRALGRPDGLAYTFLLDGEAEEISLTYGELDRRARAVAVLLGSLGAAGERVLLLYPSGLDYVAAFFGCLYAGAVAVPLYPPRSNHNFDRFRSVVADSGASIALTAEAVRSRVEPLLARAADLRAVRWVATDDLDAAGADGWGEPRADGRTLAFLQYTSGSTARPKGVMVSHGNLLHNEEMIRLAFGQTEESVIVGWLPLYHDMGLIGNVLQPLYLGARCVLMSPVAFLQKPSRWLRAISRYRATTSGGPNFAYDLCVRKAAAEESASLDLSSWDVAFNGAEPVRRETLESFAAAFGPCGFRREAFLPCYGLAEATLLVSGGTKGAAPTTRRLLNAQLERHRAVEASAGEGPARELVGCGSAWGGQEIVVADPETLERCEPGRVGEIWVAGASVAEGYWRRPAETEQTFGARLSGAAGAGPFLRTGDTGFLHDGELFVTGRLKDLIIVRGLNHYPQDIELTVERCHPALRPGGGAAFSFEADGEERLAVVQEVERRGHPNLESLTESIRRAVAEEHEVRVHAVLLIKPNGLPKTSSGKIQRHACRAAFLDGSLPVLARWQADAEEEAVAPADAHASGALDAGSLAEWLASQLGAVLGVEPSRIEAGRPLTSYGLDSLAAIEVAHRVEVALGVSLSPSDLLREQSVAGLAERVRTLPAARGSRTAGRVTASTGATAEQPLSHGQRALWFLHELAPESPAYNIGGAVRVREALKVGALRRAFEALAGRHELLRASLVVRDGKPALRINERAEVGFDTEDASGLSEAELNARLSAESRRAFDLERGPLLRVKVFGRGAREFVILTMAHHLVADFWSLSIIARELGALYRAEQGVAAAPLPALGLRYADFVRWQSEMLAGPEGEAHRDYWLGQLAGAPQALELPTDRPRPPVQTFEGDSFAFRLGGELSEKLRSLSRARGVTLHTMLLAAFQVLVHRYSGQEDLLLGSATAGRGSAGLSPLVGYFVNPVVLRANLAGDPTFETFLEQARRTTAEAFEHQDYPFPLLVERLQPVRDPSRTPLFQVMFVWQQTPPTQGAGLAALALGEEGARASLGDLPVESMALAQGVSPFDLMLMMADAEGGLVASLRYSTDLFDADTVARMGGHFKTLLEGVVEQPSRRVSDLPLLDEAELRRVVVEWNDTARNYGPGAATIHELFEEQAAANPDAEAVVCGGEALSYGELNARANRLARHLRRLGVGPESLVGLMVERTAGMVVALLGILKAGGAYVPLDPKYPRERIAFMLEDTRARVLLTQRGLDETLPPHDAEVVYLDSDWPSIARHAADNVESGVTGSNLAYVIYTSGSTGRPKGVAIEHRSAAAFLRWARETFTAAELERVLASTSICFDLSVFELFGPLSCGGAAVVAGDALWLAGGGGGGGVTLINTVPSAMTELLRLGAVPDSVLTVNLAGEPLQNALAQRVYELGTVGRVNNLYGPSEDTTYSTWTCVPKGSAAPVHIGRPVTNTRAYVLDEWMRPVPVGVKGEIYLGGDGLARGYLGRPGLTAERFTPDPFSGEPGARLYRTGDVARHLPGGELEYLGRADQQIKLRGFRIELGEIGAALSTHPAVRECLALARDYDGGDKRLVAYVVVEGADAEPQTLPARWREYLRERLPEYMVPSAFVVLERMPLTANGKVDRKALPAPGPSAGEGGGYVAPRTAAEEVLAGIWSEVLGASRVGVTDDFFALGGHSLLATQVASRVREVFGVEVPLRSLFEHPTVEGLAEGVLRAAGAGREEAERMAELWLQVNRLSGEELDAVLDHEGSTL